MKGFILINAYYDREDYLYQAKRLKEEFAKRGVDANIIRNNQFDLAIENGNLISKYKDYDFCVFLDKDKYALSILDKLGVRLYNQKDAILNCDDKMLTYIELANNGISMPKTLPGILCFDKSATIKIETIDEIEKLGYPLIAKESFGSLGKGIYKIENRDELLKVAEEIKCKPHLFQEDIKESFGKDLRVIVIGGKVVGGMIRKSNGDFRSNIAEGGSGEKAKLSDEIIELSEKIAKLLKLDYCGLDLLFGKNGPILCEVNSNAFFATFEKVTNINVAKLYVEHILKGKK